MFPSFLVMAKDSINDVHNVESFCLESKGLIAPVNKYLLIQYYTVLFMGASLAHG